MSDEIKSDTLQVRIYKGEVIVVFTQKVECLYMSSRMARDLAIALMRGADLLDRGEIKADGVKLT